MNSNAARLRELALIFLRLGATAFGGPPAHIALMEREFVETRGWISRAEFLDLIGAVSIIPGPSSTQLAICIGQKRAGRAGLLVAGAAFIAPAFCMVLGLAWLYQKFGSLPQARDILRGVSPVVVAIVAQALWKFGGNALKSLYAVVVAIIALLLFWRGQSALTILTLAAIAGVLRGFWLRLKLQQSQNSKAPKCSALLLAVGTIPAGKIFVVFLKFGCVIYGSGLVLLAFLRDDLVQRLGWISDRQLLDAIAVGQITPGPVFTTATFIGFQIGGFPGAIAATLGIFAPSFFFVALLSVLLERWKNSRVLRGFLDAANAAALALMAGVTLQLGRASIVDATTTFLALAALVLLFTTRLNPAWLMLGGAVIGLAAGRI